MKISISMKNIFDFIIDEAKTIVLYFISKNFTSVYFTLQ